MLALAHCTFCAFLLSRYAPQQNETKHTQTLYGAFHCAVCVSLPRFHFISEWLQLFSIAAENRHYANDVKLFILSSIWSRDNPTKSNTLSVCHYFIVMRLECAQQAEKKQETESYVCTFTFQLSQATPCALFFIINLLLSCQFFLTKKHFHHGII